MPVRRPWAFERGTLWALDLDGQPPLPVTPRANVVFREASATSAAELTEAMGQTDPGIVRRRVDTGRRCFTASIAGKIAAYGWVSQGEECIGELERAFRMREGEAYIWDCATLPPFRRQGLYVALVRHIVASLQDDGVHRVWIGASLQNHPSIRGFASAGFRRVLDLTYVRLLGLAHFSVRGDPTAPAALVADARWSLGVGRRPASGDKAPNTAQLARIGTCAEERSL